MEAIGLNITAPLLYSTRSAWPAGTREKPRREASNEKAATMRTMLESTVLDCVQNGMTVKGTARLTGVDPRTVRRYMRANLVSELDASHRPPNPPEPRKENADAKGKEFHEAGE